KSKSKTKPKRKSIKARMAAQNKEVNVKEASVALAGQASDPGILSTEVALIDNVAQTSEILECVAGLEDEQLLMSIPIITDCNSNEDAPPIFQRVHEAYRKVANEQNLGEEAESEELEIIG